MVKNTFHLSRFVFLLKWVVVVIAFWYLYQQLFVKHSILELTNTISTSFDDGSYKYLLLPVLALMLVNWSIEAIKWKLLISKEEDVSFLKSLEAVFAGVTVSFFTPNRVGEFAGRIFFLEKTNKIEAALISILGSMSQLLITLLTGVLALLFFIYMFVPIETYLYVGICVLEFGVMSFLLYIFFNINALHKFLLKIGLNPKMGKLIAAFDLYTTKDLIQVLALSLLRYCIFTFQFFLLLRLMHVYTPLLPTVMMISMTYLVMTIPTFAFAELGIRSVVSVQFIGTLSGNHPGIITASYLLYIINVAFPALVGVFFVLRMKIRASR